MIHLRQHIPAFVDGVPAWDVVAPDTQAALADPSLVRLREAYGPEFDRWSVSDGDYLMVECTRDGKRTWWVAAYVLLDSDPLDLPVWSAAP